MNELIEVQIDQNVVHIFLNRPEKKNALSLEMMNQILSTLLTLPESTRVLVLEARGSFFCSGMDLDEVMRYGQECSHRMGKFLRLLLTCRVSLLPRLTEALLPEGLALLLPVIWLLPQVMRYLPFPELQKGLVPAFVCSLLKGQCHPRFLNELILTGDKITAPKAESAGLINQAVADLDQAVSEAIQKLLKNAPQATKLFKKHFMPRDLQTLFAKAYDLHKQVLATGESKEGLQAALERRAPKW